MYLDCKFGLSLSLGEITLLFDLSLYLDRTLAQRKAKSKVKVAHWARSSSAKRSAKKTYLAELLSTDLSQCWDKTLVLAGSLYPQVIELWAVQAEE